MLNSLLLKMSMTLRLPKKKRQEKLPKRRVPKMKKKLLQNLMLRNSTRYSMKTTYQLKFQRKLKMILIMISTLPLKRAKWMQNDQLIFSQTCFLIIKAYTLIYKYNSN
jgi:hypothetical protein